MPTDTDTPAAAPTKSMDDIVALCRRRGFIFQSSEIYGGINGFWDYGPLGVELKRNLKDAWWHDVIRCPPDGPDGHPLEIVGLDTTIIMNPKVWEASGHVAGFNDPMVDCRVCKARFRADKLFFVYVLQEKGERALIDAAEFLAKYSTAQLQFTIPTALMFGVEGDSTLQVFTEMEDRLQNAAKQKKVPQLKRARVKDQHVKLSSGQAVFVVDAGDHGPYFGVIRDFDSAQGGDVICPHCGSENTLTPPRQFNLMNETYTGAVRHEDSKTYLRPETAQGIFCNFRNITDTSRVKVPFGIAQTGKAFRNEVTPRNFTFRSREFEQMEIEFFIHPDQAKQWYAYWRDARYQWWKSVGLAGDNLQLREHDKDELAHYAKEGAGTSDVEYRFPFTAPGFGELEGVAHRTDYDLRQHAEHSGLGDKLKYFDQDRNERYFPHVIEPSAGADRGTLALICEAYTPDESRPSKVYMRFHPRMAPIKAAIFPLVNKDGMPEVAENLYKKLRHRYAVQIDVKQNIGKRYARMDEAGTPFCFTIDGQTLQDQTVTVRDRDTLEQQRINIDQVETFLADRIGG